LRRVLITGGAGFVGANLCVSLAVRHPGWKLIAVDNLHRRGSELNLPRLSAAGVEFVNADVRDPAIPESFDSIDVLIECSAEPSVLAGLRGDTSYAVHTNLTGAYNCLELARRHEAQVVFLSTSRVYPFDALNALAYDEAPTRFQLRPRQPLPGASPSGISEDFPLEGPRTLYGTTKLAAELLIAEYAAAFGISAVIIRCGVIAGPWQMGTVGQGAFTFWLLRHRFREPLSYIGFGGSGKQVRDLLHVDDLVDLVERQLLERDRWNGVTANVGGGPECSLSLLETTAICRELSGTEVPIEAVSEQRYGDVPIYISDCSTLFNHTDWRPTKDAHQILADTWGWIVDNAHEIARALGVAGDAA
jgi:CDP-paratose 2-epimerase